MMIEEALAILDTILDQVPLNDVQELVFRHAWENWTYEQMAERLGYTTDYVRNVGSQLWLALSKLLGVRVSKKNLQTEVRRWAQQHRSKLEVALSIPPKTCHQELGEAPDVTNFAGRDEELHLLKEWVLGTSSNSAQRCRLIALLGMGGMGKTALAAKLTQQVSSRFDAVIWRSLRNAPPIEELLAALLQFLTPGAEPTATLPCDRSGRINRLIDQLRSQRCLIILDNAESVLPCHGLPHTADNGYLDLLHCLCDLAHDGCVILTSREKPDAIAWKEGIALPVRSLHLCGLSTLEAKTLFTDKGCFIGSGHHWQTLTQHYAGNPLALKMVASAIQDLFSGNISEFLSMLDTLIFDDIRDLLDRQFSRLSPIEKAVMYWLAINRDVVTFQELRDDMLCPVARQALPSVLRSLKHRFLIEKTPEGFTQQPVVMDYMTSRLIDQVSLELTNATADCSTTSPPLLQTHALLKATTKNYIRESQTRLILTPLLDRLLAMLRSPLAVEQHCRQQLRALQTSPQSASGYAAGNLVNLLQALQADTVGLDLSHLTLRQVPFQNGTWQRVNLANATVLQSGFLESLGIVWSVAFSPNGELLAAGDANGDVHLWRLTDQQKVSTCKGHTSWVCAIAFSPNSQLLASASADRTVKLWDAKTGTCLRTLTEHQEWVLAVAFSPNGQVLASSSADHTIKLWQPPSELSLHTLKAHTDWVGAIAFSPDSQLLVSGSDDFTLKLWDVQTATCLQTLNGHAGSVRSVAFSPDGQQIASGSSDRTMKQWHTPSGALLRTFTGHNHPIRAVAYQPEPSAPNTAHHLISAAEDGILRIWHAQTGECLQIIAGHAGQIRSVAIHPQGHWFASGSADQTVKLWNAKTGRCVRILQGYTNFVLSVACTPATSPQTICAQTTRVPTLVATGSSDRTVRLWRFPEGECLHTLRGHTNDVWSVAFSPIPIFMPGQPQPQPLLASASTDQTIRFWDIHTGQCFNVLRGHADWIHAIAFTPDGKYLASASTDQTARIWEVATGKCLHILQGHASHVWSVAFSPNSHLLATSSDDQTIKLWDVVTGQCLKTLTGHTRRVQAIAFSPEGNWLASSSGDQTIVIWDIKTGRCLRTLQHDGDCIRAIAISPLPTPFFQQTGHLLLCSYTNTTIKVWNANTGELLKSFEGHTKHIWSVAFTPNGQTLISGSEDNTIRFWKMTSGECLAILTNPQPYKDMNVLNIKGLSQAQIKTLKSLGAVELQNN